MFSSDSRLTVAISEQMGSGGDAIAGIVASELNLPLLEHEIIELAAAKMGVGHDTVREAEAVPPLLTRIGEQLSHIPTVEAPGFPYVMLPLEIFRTSADYHRAIDETVQAAAEHESAVILGHGAAQTLTDRANVLRVFILAPFDVRVARYATEQDICEKEARRAIAENDRQRAALFHHYHGMDWLDSHWYDLVVNTDCLCDRAAASLIIEAAWTRSDAQRAEPVAV